jgi:hypothetical protein
MVLKKYINKRDALAWRKCKSPIKQICTTGLRSVEHRRDISEKLIIIITYSGYNRK